MTRPVILVGKVAPWQDEKGDSEIWCVNGAFAKQPNCDRVYAMDRFYPGEGGRVRGQAFIEAVTALDVEVVTQRHYPEMPRSRPFKLEECRTLFDLDYYTSTMAYMMAEAIQERRPKITLHYIVCRETSTEYFPQKACLDFWIGNALGRGIEVAISSKSVLLKPYPWQTELYGYTRTASQGPAMELLAGSVKRACHMDRTRFWPDPETQRLYEGTA